MEKFALVVHHGRFMKASLHDHLEHGIEDGVTTGGLSFGRTVYILPRAREKSQAIDTVMAMAGRNVFTVLEETARQYGDAAALHQPTGTKDQRSYRSYSWNEWAQISREIALGLRELGLKKGEFVCVLSETRAEFYLVDLAVMGAGGVSAALYTAYPMPDLARNVISTAPRFLLVEDAKTLNALVTAIEEQGGTLPEHIILLTGQTEITHSLEEVRVFGREALARDPSVWTRLQAEISPRDPAILYLTSGSTGEPKAGLTSHAAIIANLDMVPTHFPIGPDDSTLVFLPSAHIAQRIVLELIPMRMGTPVWFSESLARLPADLRNVKPTVFLAPPRVWERMYATVQTELKKRPENAQKVFAVALQLGRKAAEYRRAGKRVPLGLSWGCGSRTSWCLRKSVTVWAAAYASPPAERLRWGRIWRSFSPPSACRWWKAMASRRPV